MTRKHRFFWAFFRPLVAIFLKIKFGYKYDKPKNLPDKYIVLSNHCTDFDPVFVGVSFKKQMYLVASEHITRWGLPYKLLKFGFEPIIRYKATVATSTVLDILRKVRKGARVCLFAEGVKSWDGVTCPILPATAQMIKKSGAALVTYRLTGGYFISPAWSEKGTRKGKICGNVAGVYTAEQLAEMSYEEIAEIIERDLYEDAYKRQLESPERYKGKNKAKGLENIIYICPKCHTYDKLHSEGDKLICSECGNEIVYDDYAMLTGCEHKTVYDLFNWQNEFTAKDASENKEYYAEGIKLFRIEKESSEEQPETTVKMTREAVSFGDRQFDFDKITDIAIHGNHALVFESDKNYYEIIFPIGVCAYKFLQYYREAVKQNKSARV